MQRSLFNWTKYSSCIWCCRNDRSPHNPKQMKVHLVVVSFLVFFFSRLFKRRKYLPLATLLEQVFDHSLSLTVHKHYTSFEK